MDGERANCEEGREKFTGNATMNEEFVEWWRNGKSTVTFLVQHLVFVNLAPRSLIVTAAASLRSSAVLQLGGNYLVTITK